MLEQVKVSRVETVLFDKSFSKVLRSIDVIERLVDQRISQD
jgi:hypothetical protein